MHHINHFAQGDDELLLTSIFFKIGTCNRFAVEFGAKDGVKWSNTAYLRLFKGWICELFDAEPGDDRVHREFITAENVNEVFRRYGVPEEFDLLSIDVDGGDFWIWKALRGFRPRVVVIEYQPEFEPTESMVVPYDPEFRWDLTKWYGASPGALLKLAHEKGYVLVGQGPRHSPNLFFVRADRWDRWSEGEAALLPKQVCQHRPDVQRRPWIAY